jgi:hypothetical protein
VSLRGDKRQMVAAGLFAVSIVALLVAATGCGGATTTTLPIPNVTVNPADFSTTIDNQYMPLRPGTKLIYEGTKDGAATRIEVSITKETRLIMGVTCVVVNDQVLVKGQLEEATLDWYAQDSKGNVWYFGEDSKEYQNGKVLSTKGSWEAGVEGAQPGIVMEAKPKVGDSYRQEYFKGEAEDMAQVLALDLNGNVSGQSYKHLLKTKEWTALEPGVVEEKLYAPGIGAIETKMVQGGSDAEHLVQVIGG